MRGVSGGLRRSTALLVLLAVLVAHGAFAAEPARGRGLVDRFERAKRFVTVIFSRIGWPPG